MDRGYSHGTGQRESVNPLLPVNASDNGELRFSFSLMACLIGVHEIFAALSYREGATGRSANPP